MYARLNDKIKMKGCSLFPSCSTLLGYGIGASADLNVTGVKGEMLLKLKYGQREKVLHKDGAEETFYVLINAIII